MLEFVNHYRHLCHCNTYMERNNEVNLAMHYVAEESPRKHIAQTVIIFS